MKNIHTVKIKADISECGDPKDWQSREGVKFKCNDDFDIEVTFFNRSEIIDMTGIVSATAEIMDIGQRNSAAQRNPKVILRKTLSQEELSANVDISAFEGGACHALFRFSAAEAAIRHGEKWLKIYFVTSDNKRTTAVAGWIDFMENFPDGESGAGADIEYPAALTYDDAERMFAKRQNNLSDLSNPSEALGNIGAACAGEFYSAVAALRGRGRFYLYGNSLTVDSFPLKSPFSFCITVDENFNGKIFQKGNAEFSINSSSGLVISDGASEVTSQMPLAVAERKIVVVVDSSGARAYIDGGTQAVANMPSFSFSDNGGALVIGGGETKGWVRKIKLFNFALDNSGAYYTVGQYMLGLDEDRLRFGMYNVGSAKTMPLGEEITNYGRQTPGTLSFWDRAATIQWNGNNLTYTSKNTIKGEPMGLAYRPPVDVKGNFRATLKLGQISSIPSEWILRPRYFKQDGTYYTWSPMDGNGGEFSVSGNNGIYAIGLSVKSAVPFVEGDSITLSAFEVSVDGPLVSLSDSLEGCHVRDLSQNCNHAVLSGSQICDIPANPSSFVRKLSWTAGQSNGLYYGMSSDVVALPAKTVSIVAIKSDVSSTTTFMLGGINSAGEFGTLGVSSGGWARMEIQAQQDSPLYLTPSNSTSGDINLDVMITQTRIR